MSNKSRSIILKWAENNSNFDSVRLAVCDLNGILRGKRVPAQSLKKLIVSGSRMPISTSCIDIWGADLNDSPFLFETGDADGVVLPTGAGLLPISWLERPSALLLCWMFDEKNFPSPIDSRQILQRVLEKYVVAGLKPILAFELEFYLLDPDSKMPLTPRNPITKNRVLNTSALSIDELDSFERFFSEVSIACKDHNIPSDTAISENGIGQFEINLKHTSNALVAADNALLFKRIVRGIAQKNGMKASFMAKPFLQTAGSGMHLHMSIIDRKGVNIFASKSQFGSNILKNAVGGLMTALAESTLIFAPHQNSYRRLKPDSHAPTDICWGYENRTAAIRIPGGNLEDTRLEHRVAGADANPYLVAAAVLAAALEGIENKIEPSSPVNGDSYSQSLPRIPSDWRIAIKSFREGSLNKNFYPKTFLEVFSNLKVQELKTFGDRMEEFEVMSYLDTV